MADLTETVVEDGRWSAVGIEALADRAVRAALLAAGIPEAAAEVSILACGDRRIAELNTAFRGKPEATNVLSWPAFELSPSGPGAMPAKPPGLCDDGSRTGLGDIAISYGTCRSEARDAGLSLEDHTLHLIVHGCLHLLGYDHVRDADATVMQDLEVKALANLGISNPYR